MQNNNLQELRELQIQRQLQELQQRDGNIQRLQQQLLLQHRFPMYPGSLLGMNGGALTGNHPFMVAGANSGSSSSSTIMGNNNNNNNALSHSGGGNNTNSLSHGGASRGNSTVGNMNHTASSSSNLGGFSNAQQLGNQSNLANQSFGNMNNQLGNQSFHQLGNQSLGHTNQLGISSSSSSGIGSSHHQSSGFGGNQSLSNINTSGLSGIGLGSAGLNGMGNSGLSGIGNSGLSSIGNSGLSGIGNSGLSGMGSSGLNGMGNSGLSGIGNSGLSGIGNSGLSGMGSSGLSGIGNSGLSGIGNSGLSGIDNSVLSGMGNSGLGDMGNASLSSMGSTGLSGMGHSMGLSGMGNSVGLGQHSSGMSMGNSLLHHDVPLSSASESSQYNNNAGLRSLGSSQQQQVQPDLLQQQQQQCTDSFAGGWQSNARDMADRKNMILSILRIIQGLRPDTTRLAKKLSEMAKGLEEHLYKTAKTKQEYMDQDTLRSRLFTIAQGMEDRTNQTNGSNNSSSQQQQQQPQRSTTSSSTAAPQQKKAILQQQQRLLLLRHASKCRDGPNCKTQFCGQISSLWRHLRSCRNKDCNTPHCKTSRCVLNHYRACKTNKTFASCEVCGPFTKKIKQLDREAAAAASSSDARSSQAMGNMQSQSAVPSSIVESSAPMPNPQNILSSSGSGGTTMPASSNPQTTSSAPTTNVPTLKGYLQHLQLLKRELSRLVEQERQLNAMPPDQDLTALQEQLQVRQQRIQEQQLEVEQKVEDLLNKNARAPAPQPAAAPVAAQSAKMPHSGKGKRINKLLVARPSKKQKVTKSSGSTKPSVSLLSCMTVQEITKHLESLNKRIELSARTVTYKCRPLVRTLIEDPNGWVFRDAVDPVALGVLDYFEVIKKPMHLTLVEKKLENAVYPDMESFASDVRLIFDNAIIYNGESSRVGELAQDMLDGFNQSFATVVRDIESSHNNLESKGEVCSLCGLQNRRLEPSVLYCQGACGLERIKRNAKYYTDRTKQNHWCDACYDLMKPEDPVVLDDGTKIRKHDLQDYKNDALSEEKWVSCDECKSWVHQICALFNDRMNRSDARYRCPNCELRKKAIDPIIPQRPDALKSAAELPRCKMTDAIEAGVEMALKHAYKSRADELGVSVDSVEKVQGALSIRVLSDVERKHVVGEKMYERYKDKGCASEFPVRTKCIALFQKIDGVDVLLFAMYVYEYGDLCPAPNKRRVYISYLDSIQYFEPKCYRTKVYHTIMVEYLRYVKQRGFHTAHIWSCPPTPGDDYIFYSHPKHQLVPREDMLRSWYHQMLDQAKNQGVVLRTTTLFDEYFGDDSVDMVPPQRKYPHCLPYFEGDYIPGELENIINRFGNRSSGGSSTHDSVMSRIGGNLSKMKDNFIVAHLRNRRFAAAVERGDDVSNWKEDSDDDMVRSKRAKISGKSGESPKLNEDDRGFSTDGSLSPRADSVGSLGGSSDFEPLSLDAPIGESADRAIRAFGCFDFSPAKSDLFISGHHSVDLGRRLSIGNSFSEDQGEAKKRSLDEMGSSVANYRKDIHRLPAVVHDTSDEDSPFESELFESRQQFLNYCQTTHSQFDELRRAKHTSLMILFLLHNPSAPKFVQQCGACYNDITHGIRHHCRNCSNFDLCESCYEPVTSGQWAKRDPRFAHPSDHRFVPIDMEADAEETRTAVEKMKSLKKHVELLEHASFCEGAPECSLQNCIKMKAFIKHVSECDMKPKRDCKICKKILSLCTIHARLCSFRGSCLIPFCDRIRERNNRLKRQQQMMDDRRRNAQNELYHASGES